MLYRAFIGSPEQTMYAITVDRSAALIEVVLAGMMPAEETAAFIAELRRVFVADRMTAYAMLIDVTDCPIQSQETMAALAGQMASTPRSRALAVVTGASLAKMQVRRLFRQPYARIVDTVAEGRAWVLRGVEPASSPRVA